MQADGEVQVRDKAGDGGKIKAMMAGESIYFIQKLKFRIVQILGWLFLLIYLFTHPLQFRWLLIFAFPIVHFAVTIIYLPILMLLRKISEKGQQPGITAKEDADEEADKELKKRCGMIDSFFHNKKYQWYLLTPAEDWFFFVPLLYLGSNFLTVGVSAILFAGYHLSRLAYPLWACIPKGITIFVLGMWILPKSGIFPLIIGHFLIDLSGCVFRKVIK